MGSSDSRKFTKEPLVGSSLPTDGADSPVQMEAAARSSRPPCSLGRCQDRRSRARGSRRKGLWGPGPPPEVPVAFGGQRGCSRFTVNLPPPRPGAGLQLPERERGPALGPGRQPDGGEAEHGRGPAEPAHGHEQRAHLHQVSGGGGGGGSATSDREHAHRAQCSSGLGWGVLAGPWTQVTGCARQQAPPSCVAMAVPCERRGR